MEAAGQAVISAKEMVSSGHQRNFIVFGNLPSKGVANYGFDYIFNFQQNDQALPYKDLFLETICKTAIEEGDNYLKQLFSNFYSAEDSAMALQDFAATVDFLGRWVASEEKLNMVQEKYKDKFKIFKELVKKYGEQG